MHHVNAKHAAGWSAIWIFGLSVFAVVPYIWGPYEYDTYRLVRNAAIILLPVLAVIGISVAWKYIGGKKNAPPWYTAGILVALVLFWAIFPPTWFFLEYLLFESSKIALPAGWEKKEFLSHIKAYADLASKIWAAVGAALGAAIAAGRK